MSVDLRNYVQVNINYHQAKPLNRTRDTVVLFTLASGTGAPGDKLNTHVPKGAEDSVDYFDSLADYDYAVDTYNAAHTDAPIDKDILRKHAQCYFANGGIKLKIVGGYSGEDAVDDKAAWIFSQCEALPYEDIIITSDQDEAVLEATARLSGSTSIVPDPVSGSSSVSTLTGYKEKMFIASTSDKTLTIDSPENIPNFVIKFGPSGIEMAAAAYLAQVSINQSKTIADYCYTIENVSMFNGAVVDNNSDVVTLANKDFNVDTTLVNNHRNVYGNTVSGADMMNYYIRIILTQTLTDRILNVLVSKIKLDRSGINKVANAIAQELNIYKSNGYLDTEAIWNEEDLYYSFNGVDYLVCSRNTPLKMGYKFTILPVGSLTQEQRDAHAFPPVYVLIADSNSIRRIVVNGDAF